MNVHIMEDFIGWNYTRSRTFSVSSAYHREWEHQHGYRGYRTDGQGSVSLNTIWKEIRKLKVPGKVKIFAWKVLHGVLPCYGVLSGRHIRMQIQCTICSSGPEDIQHCLFMCIRVREVWKELGLSYEIQKAVPQDRSGSVTLEILAKLQAITGGLPSAELAIVAAWFLWWQR